MFFTEVEIEVADVHPVAWLIAWAFPRIPPVLKATTDLLAEKADEEFVGYPLARVEFPHWRTVRYVFGGIRH